MLRDRVSSTELWKIDARMRKSVEAAPSKSDTRCIRIRLLFDHDTVLRVGRGNSAEFLEARRINRPPYTQLRRDKLHNVSREDPFGKAQCFFDARAPPSLSLLLALICLPAPPTEAR